MTSFLILAPAINQIQCHRQDGNAPLREKPRQWDQLEASAPSSPRKGRPPSSQKRDGSCRALTQSENNIPRPAVTPSQDALCADISSGGPVAPPSHLKAEPIPFLRGSRTCLQVGTESCYWPGGHRFPVEALGSFYYICRSTSRTWDRP